MLELRKARTSSTLSLLRARCRSVRRWSFRSDYSVVVRFLVDKLHSGIVRFFADWRPLAACQVVLRQSQTSNDYLRRLRMIPEDCTGLDIKNTKDFDDSLQLQISRQAGLVAVPMSGLGERASASSA